MKDIHQVPGREPIWTLRYTPGDGERDRAVTRMSEELGISVVTARLLCNRGYGDPDAARRFLANDGSVWNDPFLMADMEPAVTRVLEAVEQGEKIAVYGDYDVDGVTSVTSLYLYLTELGGDVICYIPNRSSEGYGMSEQAISTLAECGVTLIITVDTGITANREIAYASSLGIDTVVTDHHECHATLPDCVAVVNPHRPDCPYPFKELAGVGVVFKLICACEATRACLEPFDAVASVSRFIDLVAIGTVADVMPLSDENRFIVSCGLTMLDHTDRPGLAALLDAISSPQNLRPTAGQGIPARPRRKVNAGLVGFGIAPRINAAGRIAHAMKAVELLLADTPDRAMELALELCEINTRRQAEENRIAEEAYRMINSRMEAARNEGRALPRLLVLDHNDWMQGIVGIVASRITEKYGLPSILISFEGAVNGEAHGTDVGKGSGRSVKGLNLVEALSECSDLLVRFGGHELAAGLTVRRSDIPEFERRINEYAATHLTDDMTAVRYEVDCEVTMEDVTMELATEFERLEPFGVANPTPVLMLRDAAVQKIISMGAGKHTKLILCADGVMIQAVWFGMAAARLPVVTGDRVDVLFQLNINDYQGVRSLQMIVQDLRMSETDTLVYRHERARYDEVMNGDTILPSEDLVPNRDDIARVYTLLRGDERLGHQVFAERNLLARVNEGAAVPMRYAKFRFILHILDELGVCRIRESDEGLFAYSINYAVPKTCVDTSPLLRRLRSQTVNASGGV